MARSSAGAGWSAAPEPGSRQRIDEGEAAAGLEPAAGERQEVGEAFARDVAQPEAQNSASTWRSGSAQRVADVEVGAQAMGDQPLARAIERLPATRRRATARPSRPAAATTSRCRRRARRSRRRSAAVEPRVRPRRVPRSTRRRGWRRGCIGRGAGTSRRIRAPGPRSRRRIVPVAVGRPSPPACASATSRRLRSGRRAGRVAAAARSVTPDAAGSAGTRCPRPCPRSRGRAGPSPRGRRRLASCAPARTTGS